MTEPNDLLGDTAKALGVLKTAYENCDGSDHKLRELYDAVGAFVESFTRTDKELERQRVEIRLEARRRARERNW